MPSFDDFFGNNEAARQKGRAGADRTGRMQRFCYMIDYFESAIFTILRTKKFLVYNSELASIYPVP